MLNLIMMAELLARRRCCGVTKVAELVEIVAGTRGKKGGFQTCLKQQGRK